VFGGFSSAIPAPLTRDILFGSKPALDTISTYNIGSIFGAGYISKSS